MEAELDLFSDRGTRSPLALPMGYVLDGRYKLGRVLGVGGFGITYAGQTMDRMPVDVAIKEFLPSSVATRAPGGEAVTALTDDRLDSFQKGLEAFVEEARLLTAFREEPTIVTVIRFVEANGTAYLVMPYYRGRSLSQHLAREGGTLHVEEAVRLMEPVLNGLSAVHGAGLLHRDIKPDNVYITDRKNVILLDFGAARAFVEDQTASHTRILSRGYAPPEQYDRSTRHGPWIDVYAAAATLYRCITGVVPQEGTLRRFRDELKPASALATVPQSLSDVLAKGLHVEYDERYQTADAFRLALHAALSTVVVSPRVSEAPPTEPPEPPTTPRIVPAEQSEGRTDPPRRRWPLALAALAVIAVGLGWAIWGGDEEPDEPPVPTEAPVRAAVYSAAVVADGPDGFLSVRTLPTVAEGTFIARLYDRARVDVLHCEDDLVELNGAEGQWCEVRVPRKTAWMVADDIGLGVAGNEGVRLVSVSSAPVFANPDARTQQLALARNRSVRSVRCEAQEEAIGDRRGRWCRVEIGPYEGWAFGGFLRVLGDSTDAAFRQLVASDSPNPTPFRGSVSVERRAESLQPDIVDRTPQEAPLSVEPSTPRPDPTPPPRPIQSLEIQKPRVTAATQTVVLDYVGRLQDGTEFDRRVGTSLPLSQLIVGLREGLVGMEAGESKRIVVPALKGYGVRGLPQRGVPGGATLTFDVTLRSFR